MMKYTYIIILLLCGYSLAAQPSRLQRIDSLEKEIVHLKQKEVRLSIELIADMSRNGSVAIPIYGFNDTDVMMFNKTVDSLTKYRQAFDDANKILMQELENDAQYKVALDSLKVNKDAYKRIKYEVFNRLQSTSESYRAARKNRDKALTESNIALLRHTAQYYESIGKVMPLRSLEGLPFDYIGANREIELLRLEISYASVVVFYCKKLPPDGVVPEKFEDLFHRF